MSMMPTSISLRTRKCHRILFLLSEIRARVEAMARYYGS